MPLISVIVTAYRRRQYLYNALLSVKAQTLSKDKYEVIVVKDFEDPQVDSLVKEMGWRSVYSDSEYQGRMYLNGLKEANGDVIAFLDDDDTYMPNKLEYVYSVFERNPDIGYLQHSFTPVGVDGSPRPCLAREAPRNLVPQSELKLAWKDVEKGKDYGVQDPVLFVLGRYRMFADKNSTTIVVRRGLLERRKDVLAELPIAFDSFLFASALADRVPLYFSDAPLSSWRFHGSNFSTWYMLPDTDRHKAAASSLYYLAYGLIGRKVLNCYPNYYICQSERHKLAYLGILRRLGLLLSSPSPDVKTVEWCCANYMCFSELYVYLLSSVKQ
jgi:glycosyltransferase involved in cell wall biosynthesis